MEISDRSRYRSQPDEEIADLSAEETDEETVDLSTEEKAAEEVSDISEEKTSEADDFDIVTADTIDLGKVVTEQALAEAVEHITDTESATDDITQKELADNTAVEVTKEVLKKEDRWKESFRRSQSLRMRPVLRQLHHWVKNFGGYLPILFRSREWKNRFVRHLQVRQDI